MINVDHAVKQFISYHDKITLLLLDTIIPKKESRVANAETTRIKHYIKALFISGHSSDVIDLKGAFQECGNLVPKPVGPMSFWQNSMKRWKPTASRWQLVARFNKYPPAEREVLRLLAPQRGLIAIEKQSQNRKTNRLLAAAAVFFAELSNSGSPPPEV